MPTISRRAALALGPALGALPAACRVAAAAGPIVAGVRILLLETEVAGTAYYDAKAALPGLAPGDPLALRREPDNRHDALAIEVFAANGMKLGYVPRIHNPPIARLMDAGKRIEGTVVEVGLPMTDYLVLDRGRELHIVNAGPRRRRVNYGGVLMALHLAE